MSFKTKTGSTTVEPSLLDVFGPSVSPEIEATNKRAAKLSMADISSVLNKYSRFESAMPQDESEKYQGVAGITVQTPLSNDEHATWMQICEHEIDPPPFGWSLRVPEDFLVNIKKTTGTRHRRARNAIGGRARQRQHSYLVLAGETKAQQTAELVRERIEELIPQGVDQRTITVNIEFLDPETGIKRTIPAEYTPKLRGRVFPRGAKSDRKISRHGSIYSKEKK